MKLVLTCREMPYDGKVLYEGDEFEASDKDAKVLKAIKKAADAPNARGAKAARNTAPAGRTGRMAFPEPPKQGAVEPVKEVEPEPMATGSFYGRRDMRAQD